MPIVTTLASVLSESLLRKLASAASFSKSERYWEEGAVGRIKEDGRSIWSKVRGTEDYTVNLCASERGLESRCSCPLGIDGVFCKHCVALGLAWLRETMATTSTSIDDVREYLLELDKDVLAEMVLDQAIEDDLLWQRLFVSAGLNNRREPDVALLRQLLREAIQPDRFIGYRESWPYCQRVLELVDATAKLVNVGKAADAVDLTEYALTLVEGAMESIDDSDGGISEVLDRLQDVHFAACSALRPDPEELARRLFDREYRSDWSVFTGAAATYVEILGPIGMQAYRDLAQAQWATVPALGPGEKDQSKDARRFRITAIMKTIAGMSGDPEELVAVMCRDLSSAYSYLEIATIYKAAGDLERAMEWAHNGARAFEGSRDTRLLEFLAAEYLALGQHEKSMELAWATFMKSPTSRSYDDLKKHAMRASAWPADRERAIEAVRAASGKSRSNVVMILLAEGEVDAAWEEASSGECLPGLWLRMADLRAQFHPEDSIKVYRSQVKPAIDEKNNTSYEHAVELLLKIRDLMAGLGRLAEFRAYVESVRTANKPKRNLMKMLDQETW